MAKLQWEGPCHHGQGSLPSEARRDPPRDGLLRHPRAFHAAGPGAARKREIPPVSERNTVCGPSLLPVRELHRQEVVGTLPARDVHVGRVGEVVLVPGYASLAVAHQAQADLPRGRIDDGEGIDVLDQGTEDLVERGRRGRG